MAQPSLFTPIKVGHAVLQHRVVMCPLTRYRSTIEHIPTDLMVTYYGQRASTPGTLLITEGTFITPQAGGYTNVPGIWNDAQVAGWKRVTDEVHSKGSFIFVQLWALGRAADPKVLEDEGPFPYVSASDVKMSEKPFPPRPLTIEEIHQYAQDFATAAKNAVRAGFDGIEIHGANSYLVDQFIQDVTNKRTDEYGGSEENRSRFALEVIEAISAAIGQEKTAIRLSPWGTFGEMRMADPKPTYAYLVKEMAKRFPNMAYIHLVEARAEGNHDRVPKDGESNDFLRALWSPRPFISAGGYDPDRAYEVAETKGDLIAFGRAFIANPDLPVRIKRKIPLAVGDRNTYYSILSPKGYIDYPFASTFAGLGFDTSSFRGVVQSALLAAVVIVAAKFLYPTITGRR